ncbi:MAG: phosphoserine phosphatase SerB [Agromyces sp.]
MSLLVVLDADSTLIQNEAIELLAEEAGSLEHVAAVTERAMRGELDFAASLRERVATLAGLDDGVFARAGARIVPTPGVDALIAAVHRAGGTVGVVSGGFHELLDPVQARLGFDRWRANRLEVVDGHLTGTVRGDIVDAETKAEMLRQWALETGATRTVAIGDGANDLRMMAQADLGIAFCAKPIVRAQADVAINEPNLAEAIAVLGLD